VVVAWAGVLAEVGREDKKRREYNRFLDRRDFEKKY